MSGMPPSTPSNSSSSQYEYENGSGSTDSAPLGIWVIAILGGIVSLLAFFPILAIMGSSGAGFLIGAFLFALNVAQLYVLVGLVRLESWAWLWALALFGLSGVIDLFSGQVLSLLITIVIIAYLLLRADYYG